MAAFNVTVPAPTFVRFMEVPEIMPLSVKLPAPPTELLAAMAMVLLTVAALVASLLIKAPPALIPVPLMVRAFSKALPFRSKDAPYDTVNAPVPNAPLVMLEVVPVELMPSFKVPPEMVVPPL